MVIMLFAVHVNVIDTLDPGFGRHIQHVISSLCNTRNLVNLYDV